MPTKVYGTSDDLVEIEGDVRGEVNSYGTDDRDKGVLLMMSDGTLLEVKYGKAGMAVWGIMLIKPGTLFDRIDICTDENADPYSDVAHFRDGLVHGWYASTWGKID